MWSKKQRASSTSGFRMTTLRHFNDQSLRIWNDDICGFQRTKWSNYLGIWRNKHGFSMVFEVLIEKATLVDLKQWTFGMMSRYICIYYIYIRIYIYIIIYVYIWSFCAALSSHGWLMGWFITNIWDTNFQAFLVRWGAHGPIPWYPTTHLTCQKMLRTVVLVLGALKYHVRSHHPQDTYYNLVQHDITWYHLVFFSNFWKSMYQ